MPTTSLAALPASVIAALTTRYGESQRAYHDWSHIEALLALWEECQARLADPLAVLLAILFHDAIYDPASSDNEELSAQLLETEATDLASPLTLARAATLIRATRQHGLPDDCDPSDLDDAAHFLDMDLAILGAEPGAFGLYEDQIRREYAHVPDAPFAAGRTAVIDRFADRPSLYFSDWGRSRFEAKARANLARSLARWRGD
jgi:predicted metal-dependent HD superfamily phosphohydrolase